MVAVPTPMPYTLPPEADAARKLVDDHLTRLVTSVRLPSRSMPSARMGALVPLTTVAGTVTMRRSKSDGAAAVVVSHGELGAVTAWLAGEDEPTQPARNVTIVRVRV